MSFLVWGTTGGRGIIGGSRRLRLVWATTNRDFIAAVKGQFDHPGRLDLATNVNLQFGSRLGELDR